MTIRQIGHLEQGRVGVELVLLRTSERRADALEGHGKWWRGRDDRRILISGWFVLSPR